MSNTLIGIVTAIIVTLLGGGLLGAIYTGRTTKSVIEKNSADALSTYQKIADVAASSMYAALEREAKQKIDFDRVLEKLDKEAHERLRENRQLKAIIVQWDAGIKILHQQLKDAKATPLWIPNFSDLDFLKDDKYEDPQVILPDDDKGE